MSGPGIGARLEAGRDLPAAEQLALATDGFADAHPELSSRARPSRPGRRPAVLAAVGAVGAVVVALWLAGPATVVAAAVGVLVLLHCATTLHRLDLVRRAVADDPTVEVTDGEARAVPDTELPVYTVLVPAYREPEVIARVVAGTAALDYPADRLEVLLLLEADDHETLAAARAALGGGDARGPVRIVEVPPGEPRTKPKACNVGLLRSRGELVTIYDAEDRPEPLQLRRAAVAFARLGDRVACLQARLSYHNAEQNLLTRWFTVEYDTWFRWFLPGLMASGAPIPLGGTSNHIRRRALVAVGAWDPYNVTEDADLGLRLARAGHRVAMLGSTTLEEANSDAVNWIKQRSRWYKGYLQSFAVHARHPVALYREIGLRGIVGMVLFVAATPVLAMVNPVFWVLTAMWVLARPGFVAALFPPAVYYPGLAVWAVGGLAAIGAGVANARAAGKPHLAAAALLAPLYWVLMSLAAIKAGVQLVRQPSYWEKTTHGLDAQLDTHRPDPHRPARGAGVTTLPRPLTRPLPGALPPLPAPRARRRTRRPSTATWWFLVALAAYVTAAAVLVLGHDGVMEDALARVSAASSVWSSADPKLAAIGYVWTPLPALLMVPFTPLRVLWPALVSHGFLAALLSAVAAAAAVATTWGLLGDLRVRPAPRAAVTLLLAVSPIVVFHAADGMTEMLLVALLLAAARRLLRWVHEPDTTTLVAAGLLLGLGYLARYEALVAAVAVTVLVAAVSAARPADLAPGARRRDAVLVDALLVGGPSVVAFAVWAAVSWLVVGAPFEQFTSAYGNAALLAGADPGTVSLATPARQLSWLAPGLAPLLVGAVVVALVGRSARQRVRRLAAVAVPVAVFGSVLAFEWATYLSGNLFGFLRYQIAGVPLVVVLLGLLLARRPATGRSPWRALGGTVLAAVVLGAGIATSATAMLTRPVEATQEYHRLAPLVADLAGDTAPADPALGMWASDRAVAARVDALVEAGDLPPASVLVDSGSGFAVVAASRHPDRFLITSDDGFTAALADPPAHGVRLVLRSEGGGVDAVRTTWASFGTPTAPTWVRSVADPVAAPATRFSTPWSLWAVAR